MFPRRFLLLYATVSTSLTIATCEPSQSPSAYKRSGVATLWWAPEIAPPERAVSALWYAEQLTLTWSASLPYFTLELPLLYPLEEELELEEDSEIDSRRLFAAGLTIAQRFYDTGCIIDDLADRGWSVRLLPDADAVVLVRQGSRQVVDEDVVEVLERHDGLLISMGDYPEPRDSDLLWETREGHLIPHRHEPGGKQLSVGDEGSH